MNSLLNSPRSHYMYMRWCSIYAGDELLKPADILPECVLPRHGTHNASRSVSDCGGKQAGASLVERQRPEETTVLVIMDSGRPDGLGIRPSRYEFFSVHGAMARWSVLPAQGPSMSHVLFAWRVLLPQSH